VYTLRTNLKIAHASLEVTELTNYDKTF